MSAKITNIDAREIIDCRGDPTLEVSVKTENDIEGRAMVPCGRSRGRHEAVELRDGGSRYGGRGVRQAAQNVREVIAPQIRGRDVKKQRSLDKAMIELDGTEDKSNLGANAILGVSLAAAKASAVELDVGFYQRIGGLNSYLLPVPVFDVIEGGLLAATDLDFQEHQILPVGASSFSEALRMGQEVYQKLGEIVESKWGKHSLNVGVEGGYTPPGLSDPREALSAAWRAIESLGYDDDFGLGLDVAASHFYDSDSGTYSFMNDNLSPDEMIEYYSELCRDYPILSIEDPLEEDDFEGYSKLTDRLDIQIVGDDLFVTNPSRLRQGIEQSAGNALLLKANQIGTLTETLDAAELAFRNGYGVQVSERSGQTEDTWLADLTVGINAGQIKTGMTRGERTAKYNRLLRIERELGSGAGYAGPKFRTLL